MDTLEQRARTALAEPATRSAVRPPAAPAPTSGAQTPLAALGDIVSTWIISPLIFLFLLRDTGEIKRGLLRAVPNRLFEPALNVFEGLIHASLVGLIISTRPPRSRTFCSKSEVPPGPSPVGFSSQTRSARIFPLWAASTRAVLMIQRLVRA